MKSRLLIVTISVILLNSSICLSQTIFKNKFNIGFNPYSGVYVGFNHEFSSFYVGLDAGTSMGLIYPSQSFSITLDNGYNFGTADNFGYKTWNFNLRGVYINVFEEFSNKPSLYYLLPGIGKEFNFSPKFGISLTAGVAFLLSQKDKSGTNIPIGSYHEFTKTPTPDFKLEFFIRF